MTIFAALAALGAAITAFFFRKGGIYNPKTLPAPSTSPVAPSLPIAAPSMPQTAPASKITVEQFCTFVRDYEGKPGDLNYLLNNPLDCRPSPVGYLPKYGNVEIIDTDTDPRYLFHVGKFARFDTYALGWEYGVNMVHFIAVNHPDETIATFFNNFAPSGDKNDPERYAEVIAGECKVPVNCTLAQLFG